MVHQQEREAVSFRTTIKESLLSYVLKRGSWRSVGGALLLILAGTLLPLSILKIVGIPLFFLGIFLIAWGLLPYKKLTYLQLNPNELYLHEASFIFFLRKKPLFQISQEAIAKMEYIEKKNVYGIAIVLKKPCNSKIHLLQKKIKFLSFMWETRSFCEECDLFLPYFTKHSYDQLCYSRFNLK